MKEELPPGFQVAYQTHLQRLRLAGFRPKTIEAYSLGLRRAARYFDLDKLHANFGKTYAQALR